MAAAYAGADKFILKDGSVTLEFVVTESGSIKIIGNGELGDEATHTLTLKLEPLRPRAGTGI
jgi:hypothetical protein